MANRWMRTLLKNDKIQDSRLKLGQHLREIIVHYRIDEPETLFVSCHAINFTKIPLGTLDFNVAEVEAYSKVLRKLEAMTRELEGR